MGGDMFKNLIYLMFLASASLFAMEKYPIKEGKQEIEEPSKQTEEKFAWEELPRELQHSIIEAYPWTLDKEHSPESVIESFRQYEAAFDKAIKLNKKSILEDITRSYKTFLKNNLSDEDFKILNQYISDSFIFVNPLPKDFNLLVRLLIKLNKLDKIVKDKINIYLDYYVLTDQFQSAKELIKSGADLNENRDGRTSLLWAISTGKEDMVKLLIKSGADINAIDKHGETVLQISKKTGRQNIINLIETKIERQRARRERKDCSVM